MGKWFGPRTRSLLAASLESGGSSGGKRRLRLAELGSVEVLFPDRTLSPTTVFPLSVQNTLGVFRSDQR